MLLLQTIMGEGRGCQGRTGRSWEGRCACVCDLDGSVSLVHTQTCVRIKRSCAHAHTNAHTDYALTGSHTHTHTHTQDQVGADREANVVDAAMGALGAVARALPWHHYDTLLSQFMRAMKVGVTHTHSHTHTLTHYVPRVRSMTRRWFLFGFGWCVGCGRHVFVHVPALHSFVHAPSCPSIYTFVVCAVWR